RALRIKADYHFNAGEFEEAELAYARLARDYPRGQYHRVAMRRSGESALARFPGVEFDDADLLEAEVYFQDFLRRYPTYAADAQVPQTLARIKESRAQKDYTIGRYYERIGKIDAAAYYFRVILEKWPATTWAVKANQRLIALGAIEEEFYEEMGYDESGNDLVEEPAAHND
ncbi:MAG: outer membrane protein assembly factor BamD, partial [Planctomycetota bacterium]|nr:outer membrane protein assembly factor BamD [Planctomycetota bacterium]